MLKPILLSEQEAIDEALRTAAWSFEHGAETVVLFMNTVKENTIQSWLHDRPELGPELHYQPPFVRSAIEVLRLLPDAWRRRTVVLGPQSAVPAHGMPRACPLCSWAMNGAVIAHNLYRDAGILHAVGQSRCTCKVDWERELSSSDVSLEARATRLLDVLEATFCSSPGSFPRSQRPLDVGGLIASTS